VGARLMGGFLLHVRFPDGEIWHGCYDSYDDTAARFLWRTEDEALHGGWCMEGDYREDGDLDGLGDPVGIATDYDDIWWPGTALRMPGPGDWCWLTGPLTWTDETVIEGVPEWLKTYRTQRR
jgi:hypothetical protein